MEQWKKIKDYENYSVSNFGNVRNDITNKKIYLNDKGGEYLSVNLYKNNKRKRFYVHRLVAIYFIENKDNKPEVNHIDGDKHNNDYTNLEWVTRSENIIHALKNNLIDTSKISKHHTGKIKCNYKVYSYNVKTKEVNCYNNIHDLFNEFVRTEIYRSIKYGTIHKGFIFSKTNDFSKFENSLTFEDRRIKINETKPISKYKFKLKLKKQGLNIDDYSMEFVNKNSKGIKQYLFFRKNI